MATIRIDNIQPKSFKRGGQVRQPKQDNNTVYNAIIEPGVSIRIFGQYGNHVNGPQTFDRVYRMGDTVEYGSYNLPYTGQIVSIGPKTVTVRDHRTTCRLDLNTFCWRNWDFSVEKARKEWANWND